jgi:Carboxypeptidase regulatory-like domain
LKQVCLWLVMNGALWAQVAGTSGEIGGMVTDPAGSAVPGAAIVVTNQDTGLERKVTTGATGEYRVPTLLSGLYQVRAEKENFQSGLAKDIRVTIGQISPNAGCFRRSRRN